MLFLLILLLQESVILFYFLLLFYFQTFYVCFFFFNLAFDSGVREAHAPLQYIRARARPFARYTDRQMERQRISTTSRFSS